MNEQLQEQASSFVLGAMPENERVEFEQTLAGDPELQRFVRELQDSLGEAARSLPARTPSPALKKRILDKVAATPVRPAPQTMPVSGTEKNIRFPVWIPWAAAAGFAVLAGWLWTEQKGLQDTLTATGNQIAELKSQLEASQEEAGEWRTNAVEAAADATELRDQVASIERERSELETTAAAMEQEAAELRTRAESAVADADDYRGQAEALEETVSRMRIELARAQDAANLANMRVARLASLAADQPQAMGVSLWNGSTQQGVLLVENLPLLPAGKTYQFWVIDPSTSTPVSAGIFATDSAGRGRIVFRPSSNVRTAAQFAISVEPPGGSQQEGPSGPVVMAGETTSL